VHREERERHPLGGQNLQVRQLSRAVRSEAVSQTSAHRRGRAYRLGAIGTDQAPHQEEREEPGQRERRNQRDVVCRDGVRTQPLDGRGDEADAGQVLRQRQRPLHRMEDGRAPPAIRERHRVRIPPEKPRVQDGIARVVGHARGETGCERPRPENRERQKHPEHPERTQPHPG
jgi:hypothetical protein